MEARLDGKIKFLKCGAIKRTLSVVVVSVVGYLFWYSAFVLEPFGIPHGNDLFSYLRNFSPF
jgi:hypothetical protein